MCIDGAIIKQILDSFSFDKFGPNKETNNLKIIFKIRYIVLDLCYVNTINKIRNNN